MVIRVLREKTRSAEVRKLFFTCFSKKVPPTSTTFPYCFSKNPYHFSPHSHRFTTFSQGKNIENTREKKIFSSKKQKTPPLLGQSTRES